MSDLNDLISLLVTVDLGILAAALTLLALYPAIAFAMDSRNSGKRGVPEYIKSERRRRNIFRWLAVAGASSSIGLTALFGQAVFGVLVEVHSIDLAGICTAETSAKLNKVQAGIAWFGAAMTAIAILSAMIAGLLMFRMTSEAA